MKNFSNLILDYLKNNAYKTCRKANGDMKYPYIEPGASYIDTLWDWDARFALEALIDITEKLKKDKTFDYQNHKDMVINCGKGCVLNFFDVQKEDGFIPVALPAHEKDRIGLFCEPDGGRKENHIKPVLVQHIKMVSEYCNDYSWFDFSKVVKYFDYYEKNQFDERTGLYIWQNDLRIGIDNNPAVYFRPERSSADIYLNTLMYVDMMDFYQVLIKVGENLLAKTFFEKATTLKEKINKEMYDSRDAFYYSQDILIDNGSFNRGFHTGYPINYKGLPIKIRSWVGLMPLWAGIPTEENAKQIVERNFFDDSLFCEAGIRSLAKNEKMFSEIATNNPSNHLGPVWIINNIIVWQGLQIYGFFDLANQLKEKTIKLLGNSITTSGGFYESYEGNGKPMLFCGFLSWNLLVSKMLD